MQYSGLVPLYCHDRVNNSKGFSWHVFNGNVNSGDYYWIIPQQSLKNRYFACDKEVMKQMIQNQDEIFRHQVQELHRLYKNQRDLTDEDRRRGMFIGGFDSQTLKSVPCSSQARPEVSRAFTSQLPMANNSEKYIYSTSAIRKFKQEECTLLNRDDDPGVYYVDTRCRNAKQKFLFDLNEPLKPEPLASSSIESSCFMKIIVQEEETPETSGLLRHEIDLNTVPLIVLSESADGITKETGSESPDNKQCSFSRGAVSEDTIAAETLQVMKDVGTLTNSLSWFAEIASSMGDDLDYKSDGLSQLVLASSKLKGRTTKVSHIVKEETECDKTYLGFSCSDNVKKLKSSVSKKSIARAKQCFMSNWGRMKQRGVHRRSKQLIVS